VYCYLEIELLFLMGPAARELSRLLGEPGPNSEAAGAQLSRVKRTLETMRWLVAEYQSQVKQTRQQPEEVKSRAFTWITPAVFVSLVSLWLALSQVSPLSHAWFWWRHWGRNSMAA
jgi:hypothetical protein